MRKIIPMLGVVCLGMALAVQAYQYGPQVDTVGSQSLDAARGSSGNAAAAVIADSSYTYIPSYTPSEPKCCCGMTCGETMDFFGKVVKAVMSSDLCSGPCSGSGGACFYSESGLPEWDRSFFSSVSRDHVNYRITPAAVEMDSDVYTVKGGVRARKEKLSFATELRYSLSDGNGVFEGLDSETCGLLLMSGYQLLSQREQLVNLSVYGLLDVSHLTRDSDDDQWRVMPGVGVAVNRITSIGMFSTACTFNHSRNLSGDKELSGDEYINTPELIANYTLPIGRKFYISVGVQHSYSENVASNEGDRFTEVHLTPVGYQGDVWGASLELSQSVDGNNNNGVAVHLARAW
jgi:hypothetical protein